MPLGLRLATGRDLDELGVVVATGALKVDEHAAAALALPGIELDGGEILDVEALLRRHAFGLLPVAVVIEGVELPGELLGGRMKRLIDCHCLSPTVLWGCYRQAAIGR